MAFPDARYFGFDLFPPNIEKARANAAEAGVATFDLIHDLADPMGGLKVLRRAVKDDGIFVLMDITCEDDPADNEGPRRASRGDQRRSWRRTVQITQC